MMTHLDLLISGIAVPFALSAVALLGYIVGLRHRKPTRSSPGLTNRLREKMDRTDELLSNMDSVSRQLRRHLAARHAAMLHCRQQIEDLTRQGSHIKWKDEASAIGSLLDPADKLTREIALAYDELRRSSRMLSELRAS